MRNSLDRHIFALYNPALSVTKTGSEISITEKELLLRITKVLRLGKNDQLVLFNGDYHALVTLQESMRKSIEVKVNSFEKNIQFKPYLSFLLPILKRDSLAAAVYQLVEAGVNKIQLIETEKESRKWGEQKELDRLRRVIISAAEQSKNFSFSDIKDPIPFTEALERSSNQLKYFGDPNGTPFIRIMNDLKGKTEQKVLLATGPEGGFTSSEKDHLKHASFAPICLGSTIFRAETAAFYLGAIFRTVFL